MTELADAVVIGMEPGGEEVVGKLAEAGLSRRRRRPPAFAGCVEVGFGLAMQETPGT